MKRRHVLALLGLAALLPGCAATGFGAAGLRDGAFYDTRSGERLGRRRLSRRLLPAPIVLLGEVHDNAVHHRIRGVLLHDWVRGKPSRPAAIVFEQFDREYNDDLRLAQRRQAGDRAPPETALAHLLDAARFDRKSWGWPAHRPLFEAAQASGATWIAANFSRASAQRLARGAAEVEPVLKAVVESARWSDEAQQALGEALELGHCGALPEAAVAGIARIQRLRDAALALPLLDASDRRSMLLAGNGHVRRDYGVPLYLGAFEREALVVGFEEVAGPAAASTLDQAAGAERAAEFGRAYDLVFLTRVVRTEDPCAALKDVSPAAPTQTPSR